MRPAIHLVLHLVVPLLVARIWFLERWQVAYLIMLSALIIDVDHFLADPVFDPNRCGINFHPLHSYPAIGIYFLLVLIPKVRIFALGLLIHVALDGIDCIWQSFE